MLLSILFMFFCALLLIPFIVFAMYLMFSGDAERARLASMHLHAHPELDVDRADSTVAEHPATTAHGSPEHQQRPLQTA